MGNIVMGISPDSPIQQDLFDLNAEQIQKMRRLDEVIDRINRMHGSETIVIGAQQYTQKMAKAKLRCLPARALLACYRRDARMPLSTISGVRIQRPVGVMLSNSNKQY